MMGLGYLVMMVMRFMVMMGLGFMGKNAYR